MATGGTTNRITLKIGVLLDDKMAIAQGQKVRENFDSKFSSSMKKQTGELKNQQKALEGVSKEVKKQKTFLGELNDGWAKTVANFLKFTVIAGISMAVTVTLKQMKDLIFELDTAMTNLSIVTNATQSELAMVDKRASELTTTLGALKGEVINSITEFARAGYDLSESMFLAEKATMAANVGFTELDKITTFIIAGLKSFQLEAEGATRIMDVLFQVSNKTAIDLEGIGEAFLRSANTLKVAGATLEESAALIAAANESIQDPAKVGTALKTIASRLRGVGDEGEAIPTLAKDFKAVGVEIQNADGSFRNIYDVFQDFAVVYKTLDDLTKESLLEKLAGKRQKNIMIGLLENFDVAEMAFEEAMDSAGAVALANEKRINSLEGKTKILTEIWGEFLRQLGDSDALKSAINLLTQLIRVVTFLTNGIPALITAFVGLRIAYIGISGALATATGGLSLLLPAIAGVIGLISGSNAVTALFGSHIENISGKIAELNQSISTLQQKLDDTKAIENKTQAHIDYIEVLERQIKAEKKLKETESTKLADEYAKEIKKTTKDVSGAISELAYELERFPDSTADVMMEYEQDFLSLENTLLNHIITQKKLQSEVAAGGDAWQSAQVNIDSANDGLASLNVTYEKYGINAKATKEVVTALITEEQKLANQFFQTNQVLLDVADNSNLVSDAIEELTTKGYLSSDMLDNLKKQYPELVIALGISESAFISQANAVLSGNKEVVDSEIDKTEQVITNAQIRIKAYESERLKLVELAQELGLSSYGIGYYADKKYDVSGSNKELNDALGLLAQLKERQKELIQIDANRIKAINDYGKSTEKQKEALSELERKLIDINQEIATQQKLYARTDDADKQLEINNELIKQYKLQKETLMALRTELENEGKSISKNTAEYDDYIDQLYKYSLQIEDATNNIFSLTSANESLRTQMKESVNDLRDMLKQLVEQELKDQIDSYKEQIEQAKEQLDLKLKQLEVEKELADFAKTRAQKEKDLSKIVSKMDTLRAAASQGDMKAINELNSLEEQRVEKQEDLDTLINDRSFELRKENLENQFSEFEETQQKEIDTLEKNLKNASYIMKTSNDYMTAYLAGNMNTLQQKLLDWNKVYGTSFDIDVLSKWDKAIQMIGKFNELQSGGSFDFGNYQSSTSQKDSVIALMEQNKAAYTNADAATKKMLNERNIALAKTIGYSFNSRDGNYYSDDDGSRLMFNNTGTPTSGTGSFSAASSNEMLTTNASRTPTSGNTAGASNNVNVYIDSVTDNNVARIERNIRETVIAVSQGQLDAFKQRGYIPNVQIK